MGYGGPLGGLKELARGSRRPRPSLVSRQDLRAKGRRVSGGCGRREKALTRGPGRSVREKRERAELAGLLGRSGKRGNGEKGVGRQVGLGCLGFGLLLFLSFFFFFLFPSLIQT